MRSKLKILIFFTFLATNIQSVIIKRQLVFPSDDSERFGDVMNRYGLFNTLPSQSGNNFPKNPFFGQFGQQNQQFGGQNQNFGNFRPQNQQNQNFGPPRPQNQQFGQQNQNFGQSRPQNQQQQTSTAAPSPSLVACTDRCIENTTGQYSPVCGTDGETYHNEERFNCAVECGRNVQIRMRAKCPSPVPTP